MSLLGRKEIKIAPEDLEELSYINTIEGGSGTSNYIRKAIKRYLRQWRKENPDEYNEFLTLQEKAKNIPVLPITSKGGNNGKNRKQKSKYTKATQVGWQGSLFERQPS